MITLVNPMPAMPDGRKPVVTSGFGPRSGGMYDFHYGVDMFYRHAGEPPRLPWTIANGRWAVSDAQSGLAVPALAAADGVVVRSSWTGTGDRIRIDHGGGIETAYMHMRNRKVSVGDQVKAGQPIADISFNPWKRGAPKAQPPPAPPRKLSVNHLHFELLRNGRQIDPRPYVEAGQILPFPSRGGWLIAAAIAVAAGVFFSRYIR